jgi:transcriptional regulator with XRE-family HTH domain
MPMPNLPPTNFGKKLRQLREQAGLSQQTLADRAGIYRTTIDRIERELQEPYFSVVLAIAHVLATSLDSFLPDEPYVPTPRQPTKRIRKKKPTTEPKKRNQS